MRDINKNKIYYEGHRKRSKERFMLADPESMSDADLLELCLYMVIPRKDVKPIIKKILHCFSNLRKFITADSKAIFTKLKDDTKFPSLTQNIINNICIVSKLMYEVNIRVLKQKILDKDAVIFDNWEETTSYLRQRFGHLTREHFNILFLASNNRLLDVKTMSIGTINEVQVYEREIIRHAAEIGAVNIILTHNHFSGNVLPSATDIQLTNKIVSGCRIFDISVLDHIIITSDSYFSFKEHGIID